MVYYFKKRASFNYALIRKWFIRLTLIVGAAGFVLALIAASSEANPERGLSTDSTLAGLVLLGTGIAIGLLYLIEGWNKEKKDYYGGIYIFFILSCIITGVCRWV